MGCFKQLSILVSIVVSQHFMNFNSQWVNWELYEILFQTYFVYRTQWHIWCIYHIHVQFFKCECLWLFVSLCQSILIGNLSRMQPAFTQCQLRGSSTNRDPAQGLSLVCSFPFYENIIRHFFKTLSCFSSPLFRYISHSVKICSSSKAFLLEKHIGACSSPLKVITGNSRRKKSLLVLYCGSVRVFQLFCLWLKWYIISRSSSAMEYLKRSFVIHLFSQFIERHPQSVMSSPWNFDKPVTLEYKILTTWLYNFSWNGLI